MTLGNNFLKKYFGNQLQDLCNRLQALKFELERSITAGNRLPSMCNRLHSVEFEFKFVMAVVNHFLATGNRLPENKFLEKDFLT